MSENEPKIDSKPLEQADQYQGEKRSRPEDRILLTDDEMIEKIDEFIEKGEGTAERIGVMLDDIKFYVMFSDDIMTQTGIDFKSIEEKLLKMQENPDEVDLVFEMLPLAKMMQGLREKIPEIEERITRFRELDSRDLKSLDKEKFITYGIGDDGWTHIHVSRGKTLGDKKYMIMAEDLIKLADEILSDDSRKGIKASSYLVASDTYSGFLEALGFILDGSISEEERLRDWKKIPKEIPIHKAHVDKKDLELVKERAQMFYDQLKKKQVEDEK